MKFSSIVFRTAVAAGLTLATGGLVKALVLVEKSPEQRQRSDIGKQGAGNAICMAKALLRCEANGTSNTAECKAANPASSTVPDPNGRIIAKLTADLSKCESKLNYSKKTASGNAVTDYTNIGCPGDSDTGTVGDQPFADLSGYQANVAPSTRSQLDTLGILLSGLCADNQCAVDQGTRGMAYAKGLFKCIGRCEADYKDTKGNGGPDDLTTHCDPTGGDANFTACTGKALATATKKGPLDGTLKGAIDAALATASNDLYNQDDCP